MEKELNFKFFNDGTKLPSKSHETDGGLDIYIPESFEIMPFETKCIGLNIGVEIPEGYAGMLVPRSSSAKKGLIMQTSLIDVGYTGEIHLIITNCSLNTITIDKDSRVCSLVVYPIYNATKLNVVEEFKESARGNDGLGSSGK